MGDMDDIIQEFLVESAEGLDRLDRSLVALEQRPGDGELLADIFRCIHTIKGTSGFFGFGRLESVTHAGENLLSDLRDGKLSLTPEITSALLQLVDAVRAILAVVESAGTDGDDDFPDLVRLLAALREAAPVSPPAAPGNRRPAARRKRHRATGAAPAEAPAPVPAPEPARAGPPDSSIRVEVALLDKLMTLVGELVLARNQILQFATTRDDPALTATTQRLNLITTELQEGVMKTRMQPIGNVWSRLPRVVRDLALACGKQVRLVLDGAETELDKTIIEAIRDPLTHIVRNSVDHGIELPADRVAAGKPAEGRLSLRACHEGGLVYIEIADDGAGVDVARVKAKAIQRGLITAAQAAVMAEAELAQLVFAPGFSTAEQVSNISGRGVGMDVVRTNVEKIGGTVELHSEAGRGTRLRVKIPLTLAIVPALTVTTAGERFAIPQVSVLELVRLDPDTAGGAIERIHGAPVYRLRGRLLPLVELAQVLGLPPAVRPGHAAAAHILVLQADEQVFGLVVDEIHDTQEIVVKPLGRLLQGIGVFAGATILGDGRVALILDVPGLARQGGVVAGQRQRAVGHGPGLQAETAAGHQALLLFRAGGDRRMAIPLSRVARLEEFAGASVEHAGGHPVVQYRGGLLPLVRVAQEVAVTGTGQEGGSLRVVVYSHQGHDVGLVVEDILDVVEEAPVVYARAGDTAGTTAVIQDRVTELLDPRELVEDSGVPLYAAARPALAGMEA